MLIENAKTASTNSSSEKSFAKTGSNAAPVKVQTPTNTSDSVQRFPTSPISVPPAILSKVFHLPASFVFRPPRISFSSLTRTTGTSCQKIKF